ncbi:MAG: 30S ribosomal protein S17, partial [Leptospiraceae bacterium]|nr:30S ribosomal protein S17 [Leptospiraceae bacterium]
MKTRAKRIRTIVGRVVSDKTDKTRVILVETFFTHPKFKKTVKRSQRIKIHD